MFLLGSSNGFLVLTLPYLGPNEVTLFGWDAFQLVHGPDSVCGRSAYYDILDPMDSLDTVRDSAIHAHRRKIWDQAFSIRCKYYLEIELTFVNGN